MSAETRRTERRDTSPVGIARRARFESSLKLLTQLGLSRNAVEHYRRLARKEKMLPHELVCAIAEGAATSQTVMLGRKGVPPTKPTYPPSLTAVRNNRST